MGYTLSMRPERAGTQRGRSRRGVAAGGQRVVDDRGGGAAGGMRVRWGILALLLGFGITGYVQRNGVAVAAERMLPELGYTAVHLGWLLNAFLISYTVLQLPGALVGQWLGPRRTLTAIGLLTAAAACATAAVPAGAAGALVFAQLLAALCARHRAVRAVPGRDGHAAGVVPDRTLGPRPGVDRDGALDRRGDHAAARRVADERVGLARRAAREQRAVARARRGLVCVRTRPACRASARVTHELAEIAANPAASVERVRLRDLLALLRDRHLALVTASYFLMNYVFYLVTFWAFLYLVQARGFTLLEGGGLASLPFVCAAVAAAVGGQLCDAACRRYGVRIGMRVLPLVALPAAAAFLALTGVVANAYLAVAMLCLAFACTELNESPFWTTTMRLAPGRAMAATAVLNTGGNLGGVVATPTIAALSAAQQWNAIFALGAACAAAAAVLWLFIDARAAGAAPPASSTEVTA